MRKKSLMAIGLAIGMNLSLPLLSYANPTQSARWVGSGERYQTIKVALSKIVGSKMM